MMKKTVVLILLGILAALPLCGAESLVIAEKGKKSPYTIVVSSNLKVPAQSSARLLQSAVKQMTGVTLPIAFKKGSGKGIFIRNNSKLQRWEYRIHAQNGDLYITGRDESEAVSGTLRGVIALLEKHSPFLVYSPGETGFYAPAQQKFAVPADIRTANVPYLLFNVHLSRFGKVYETANNLFPAPWFWTTGGHTHFLALNRRFVTKHPEAVALYRGKRLALRPKDYHNHFCYSYPPVAEALRNEALQRIKRYGMIEIGHHDSFIPCECKKCKGVDKGEQLWKINLDIAKACYAKYPNRKISFMAYGVTLKAPKTISEFPPNVMIMLAPCTEKSMKDWSRIKVPGGFSAYIYNWGHYNRAGFTPKRSFKFLQDQVRQFRKNNVKGIFRCGFGGMFGQEGPAFFIWGRLWEDPEADTDKLLKRYCSAAYGNAAGEMYKFFKLFDKRLELEEPVSFNRFDLLNEEFDAGKATYYPGRMRAMTLFIKRYPPQVVAELDAILHRAEKKNPGNELIQLARKEFTYLQKNADMLNAFKKLYRERDEKSWQAFLDAAEKRKAYILTVPLKKSRSGQVLGDFGKYKLFCNAPQQHLLNGGRLVGTYSAPCKWDPAAWREAGIRPFGRTITNDSKYHRLVFRSYEKTQPYEKAPEVYCKVSGPPEKLKITFKLEKSKPVILRQSYVWITFGEGGRKICIRGRFGNRDMRVWERIKTNRENKNNGDVYSRKDLALLKPVIRGKEASVTIDLRKFGFKGNEIDFNFVTNIHQGQAYIWEYNLDIATAKNQLDSFGKLILK